MNSKVAITQYQQLDLEARLASANPHKLVSLLFQRAAVRLAAAEAAILRGDISMRTNEINGVIEILSALRSALDLDAGGELAANLRDLYNYMDSRLLEANRRSSQAHISEVKGLLGELQQAWDTMPRVDGAS